MVRKALGIPFVNRYLQEDTFRAEAAMYPGFLINILYAGVKMYSGIHYRSAWFVTLAVYYILLAVMRFSLLYKSTGILSLSGRIPSRTGTGIQQEISGEEECGGKCRRSSQERKHKKAEKETAGRIVQEQSIRPQEKAADDSKGSERSKTTDDNKASEWRRYRLCGVILLLMNVALAGMVILAVNENSGFEYPGMLIYVMAMYAFYAVITAVRNVVKFRKYGSPVLSAAKVICLTAAMVSMLSLETAMLTRFGAAEDAEFRQIMAGSTFAVTAPPPRYILCILLAVPGFLGWIFPYFLYKRTAGKQAEKLTPLVEAKYDEIYEICKKGSKLLYPRGQ